MAEIKIEKKRAMWPWVLLAILIIGGIIYLYYSLTTVRDNPVAEDANSTELIDKRENNSTVNEYITFVNNDTNKMGLDHVYANTALLKLNAAIDAMASETGFDVKADLDKAKDYADKITNDPFETSHADNIRKAADILSTALVNMQRVKYPSLTSDSHDLKDASASINPDTLTLDQKDAVKSFFSKAASLLQKMN